MTDPGTILVAGGSGRLGKALSRLGCHALGRNHLDISDASQITAIIEQSTPSVVINTAAYTTVDAAETDADRANAINAAGAGALARLCAVAGLPLIHVSTDMVFSHGDPAKPIRETTRPAPNSVYGHSKLDGEMQVQTAGGRHCIARVSWLFSDTGESFASKMLALGARHDKLDFVDDEYGRPTHVDDLASHLLKLANLITQGDDVPSLLHLGPPDPVSRHGWANEIFWASGEAGGPVPTLSPVPGYTFPTTAPRGRGVVLDVSRAEALLGPMPDWRAATYAVVKSLLGNRA